MFPGERDVHLEDMPFERNEEQLLSDIIVKIVVDLVNRSKLSGWPRG